MQVERREALRVEFGGAAKGGQGGAVVAGLAGGPEALVFGLGLGRAVGGGLGGRRGGLVSLVGFPEPAGGGQHVAELRPVGRGDQLRRQGAELFPKQLKQFQLRFVGDGDLERVGRGGRHVVLFDEPVELGVDVVQLGVGRGEPFAEGVEQAVEPVENAAGVGAEGNLQLRKPAFLSVAEAPQHVERQAVGEFGVGFHLTAEEEGEGDGQQRGAVRRRGGQEYGEVRGFVLQRGRRVGDGRVGGGGQPGRVAVAFQGGRLVGQVVAGKRVGRQAFPLP